MYNEEMYEVIEMAAKGVGESLLVQRLGNSPIIKILDFLIGNGRKNLHRRIKTKD